MSPIPDDSGPEALLRDADWLRKLAACLVHNRADAADLVQETWSAALRSPPEPGRPHRPWLAQVLRNLIRTDARARARRRTREEAAGTLETPIGTDALLERLELQRRVVHLVTELDEPFRTTILLRFFEGREPAEIAAQQGVPAGTVRWRLHEGLRRLRDRLDEAHGGRREAWRSILLPLAGDGAALRPARGTGPRRLAACSAGGVLAGVVGLVILSGGSPTRAPGRWGPSGRPVNQHEQPTQEEETMLRNTGSKAALFALALPALVAASDGSRTLTPAEATDFCVELRERSVACKEVLADIRVSRVPPEKREGSRRMILEEIDEDGTGPLEARRSKCATDLKNPGAMWIASLTTADVAAMRSCQVEKDCKNGIACWMNVVEPAVARSRKR